MVLGALLIGKAMLLANALPFFRRFDKGDSDRVCRAQFRPQKHLFRRLGRPDGNQVIPVMGITSSANSAPGIFWRISAMSPPIRSWYVCLCVPERPFR
jgi:hypothetical protein